VTSPPSTWTVLLRIAYLLLGVAALGLTAELAFNLFTGRDTSIASYATPIAFCLGAILFSIWVNKFMRKR